MEQWPVEGWASLTESIGDNSVEMSVCVWERERERERNRETERAAEKGMPSYTVSEAEADGLEVKSQSHHQIEAE